MSRVLAAIFLLSGCGFAGDQTAPFCKVYTTCYEATGGTKGSLDSLYGSMGTCWTTTQQAADTCTAECRARLAALQKMFPDAGCVVQ